MNAVDGQPPDGVTGNPLLAELSRRAARLMSEIPGPVRRIALRSGDTAIEVEWHAAPVVGADAPAGAAEATPAGPDADGSTVVAADGPGSPAADLAPDGSADLAPEGSAEAVRPEVRSPVVGTFRHAAEPGGPPCVRVGDRVEAGQVVGAVEAMKLMNQVVTERPGLVAEVLVGDGEPVEFHQPLITLMSV